MSDFKEVITAERNHKPRVMPTRVHRGLNPEEAAQRMYAAVWLLGEVLWVTLRQDIVPCNRSVSSRARDRLVERGLVSLTILDAPGHPYLLKPLRRLRAGEPIFDPDPKHEPKAYAEDHRYIHSYCSHCGCLKDGPEQLPNGTSKGLWPNTLAGQDACKAEFQKHLKRTHYRPLEESCAA